jgi:hypothetical protein
VVVRDFDVFGIRSLPTEADTILLIEANTVLAVSTAAQSFEPIPWWDCEFPQSLDAVDLVQLASSDPPERCGTDRPRGTGFRTLKDIFSAAISK